MRSIDTANIKPLEIPSSVEESLAGPLIQIAVSRCFSVQQGSMRDGRLQISRETGRIRLGRDTSHSDPLFQAAKTVVRRLCKLHSKVGSIFNHVLLHDACVTEYLPLPAYFCA